MTQAIQVEILDLRHFPASSLKPLLADESRVWGERLHWDYRTSTELLAHYLDSRVLPGFVAVDGHHVLGYVFCVYEDAKAVIGDVFALEGGDGRPSATEIERQLLEHLVEMLQHSPGTDRIEAQLLLHPTGRHAEIFRATGFEVHRRSFMERPLSVASVSAGPRLIPPGLTLRPWKEDDFGLAAHLIADGYAGHLDSRINDQYQSVAGSFRFLHNIIRFPGCGIFDPAASRVLIARSGELAGLLLCSRVKNDIGHVTQLCVAPAYRKRGLGALLLEDCAAHLHKRGFKALTLTVTEANVEAVRLYARLGFRHIHTFDATLWVRGPRHFSME
jgi:ribosomal protein S18 acetylase RimI-like enzyme